MTVVPARSGHALPPRVAPAGARARGSRARAAGRGRAHAGRRGCGLRAASAGPRRRACRCRAEAGRPRRGRRPTARVSTGWSRANVSPTRSPVRAERPRRPTPRRSTSRLRSPTGCRWSCHVGSPVAAQATAGWPRQPQLRHRGGAGRAARHRSGHSPEDPRLPRRAWRLPLGRRPRCDPGHRPGARRAAAGRGVSLIERSWPTLLVVAACVGLALANAIRVPALGAILLVAVAAGAAGIPSARLLACALALGLAGWWWGSVRLDALDASVLAPEIGRSAAITAVVTGPVRRSTFALRLPAEVQRFDERRLRERVLLELPLGRSPPQGAVLELRATVAAPRGPDDGFDERGWLARRGVHVVLHGRDWRIDRSTRRHRRPLGSSPCARRACDRACARRRAARRARRDRAGRGRGADGRAPRRLQGLRPLPPAGRVRPEHHLPRARRARAGLAARDPAARRRGGGDRGDRGLRPRGRLAAVGRARRRRRRPRLARVAALATARPLALPRARRGRPARVDARRACSSPASSSRSPPSARSSCCCPGFGRRSRAIRSRTGSARRSPSRPPAVLRRRRSSGSSSAACRSTRCRRTPSSRRRSGRCSGSRSSAP